MKNLFGALLFGFILSTNALAADDAKPKELRLNLELNKTQVYQNTLSLSYFLNDALDSTMMTMNLNMEIQYTPVALENDVYTVDVLVNRLVVSQNMQGMTMEYDSDLEKQEGMGAMIEQQMGQIVNEVVSVKVNKRGQVVEMPESVEGQGLSTSNLVENLFIRFPEEKVEEGDEWSLEQGFSQSPIDVIMHYTLEEYSSKEFEMSFKATDADILGDSATAEQIKDLKLESNGIGRFSSDTGVLLHSTVSQVMEIPNPQSGETMFLVTKAAMTRE